MKLILYIDGLSLSLFWQHFFMMIVTKKTRIWRFDSHCFHEADVRYTFILFIKMMPYACCLSLYRNSLGVLLSATLCFLKVMNPQKKLSTRLHLQMRQHWSLLQRILVSSSTGLHSLILYHFLSLIFFHLLCWSKNMFGSVKMLHLRCELFCKANFL